MDQWIYRFKNATPGSGFDSVIIPGEPERIIEMDRMENGIELMDAVAEDLTKLAVDFSIEL